MLWLCNGMPWIDQRCCPLGWQHLRSA
jgi:hypothetical protein